jgi:hypothetical protein
MNNTTHYEMPILTADDLRDATYITLNAMVNNPGQGVHPLETEAARAELARRAATASPLSGKERIYVTVRNTSARLVLSSDRAGFDLDTKWQRIWAVQRNSSGNIAKRATVRCKGGESFKLGQNEVEVMYSNGNIYSGWATLTVNDESNSASIHIDLYTL